MSDRGREGTGRSKCDPRMRWVRLEGRVSIGSLKLNPKHK